MNRSKPWLAFLLSFILPGAGLAYVGSWFAALVNFGVVHLILLGIVFAIDVPFLQEQLHYVFLVLAAGSAGYAHSVAVALNRVRGDAE